MRWLVFVMLSAPAQAESLVATRLITPGMVIAAADVALADARIPGALDSYESAVGQTARIAIYAGRPLLAADIGPPVLVKRNQTVALRFGIGALSITAEGRALSAGGAGDTVRVMNLASKSTVSGLVLVDGTIEVKGAPCGDC